MEKRISFDQFQSVKRVAQACNPLVVKRDKIRAKIEKLAAEFKDYDTQISSLEEGIKKVVGFRVEELVKKVIEPGVDVNGLPKKTTKYVPTSIVSYDEKHKQYVITTPDEVEADDAASAAVDNGNDPVVAIKPVVPGEEVVEGPVESTDSVSTDVADTTDEVPSGDAIFA